MNSVTGEENVNELNIDLVITEKNYFYNKLQVNGIATNNSGSTIFPTWYIEGQFYRINEDNNLFLIDGDKISINNSLNDGVSYEFTLEIDGEWDNILNEEQFSVLDLRAFKY